eukprot:CFRG8213T1
MDPFEKRVVGMGACGLDMMATVSSFPKPDSKNLTTSLTYTGGGNCANTLTALSRLGIHCSLVAKIGSDDNGVRVLEELTNDGVNTEHMIVQSGITTPLSYIIVDQSSDTRTCIHTPSGQCVLMSDLQVDLILTGATMLVLDTRHTAAAVTLARAANERNIPVILDVERERDNMQELIPLADYLITNREYPETYAPDTRGDLITGMIRLLMQGQAKIVITTAGAHGSILVTRECYLLDEDRSSSELPDIVKKMNISRRVVDTGAISHSDKDMKPSTISGSEHPSYKESESQSSTRVVVMQCPARPVSKIKDTTGAGDAFIGGIVYGLCMGLRIETMLTLATNIAAMSIEEVGPRAGLPAKDQLDEHLVTPY